MRAVWIGVAITAGGNIVAAPVGVHLQEAATRDAARADHTEAVWRDWREHAAVRQRAYELLTRQDRPRRRGQRKARPYTLGMRPATQAGEAELFAVLDDLEAISALVANNRVDQRQLYTYLESDIAVWLPALRELSKRSAPTFDAQTNAQLEHGISTLELLRDRQRSFAIWRALQVDEVGIWPTTDGRFDIQAAVFNPNAEDSPVPGICIDYSDQNGAHVGHLLVWSARKLVPALEAISMMVTVPSSTSCKPASVRLAATPSDLVRIRGAHYPFSDSPSLVEG